MSFDWKKTIGTIAPALASAFGGPLTGLAVKQLSEVILGKPDGTEDEIAAAMATGLKPDTVLALKQADQNFKIEIRKLDVEEARLAVDNTKDARNRDIEIVKAGKKDYTKDILAYIAIAGFFIVMYVLLTQALPEGIARDAVLILLGTLTKIVSDLYNYYFGSSAGSSAKTAILDRVLKR